MAAPPPDNPLVAKASLVFVRDTRTYINTLHFLSVAPWDLNQMQGLAADLLTWYSAHYRNCISIACALTQIQIRKLDPDDPLAYDTPVNPPIAGTLAGQASPGNASLTMSFRTGLAGRRFRGRIYNPSLSDALTGDDDRVASTLVNTMAVAAIDLISGAISGALLGIFHAPKETPTPWDNTIHEVVSAVVENVVDSQRRRLPGRGR